jgi:hypothetical protein
MPCQSYDSSWDDHDSDRDKIRELKKQADMLARIACKALQELEDNKISEVLLLRDDEVREWWAEHKEADRRAREAREAKERRAAIKKSALAKLSEEEKEVLGIAKAKAKNSKIPANWLKRVYQDEDEDE